MKLSYNESGFHAVLFLLAVVLIAAAGTTFIGISRAQRLGEEKKRHTAIEMSEIVEKAKVEISIPMPAEIIKAPDLTKAQQTLDSIVPEEGLVDVTTLRQLSEGF